MTDDEFRELIRSEEAKRERCADPRLQWEVLQQTIAWIDSQQPIPRNSRKGCLAAAARRRKLP